MCELESREIHCLSRNSWLIGKIGKFNEETSFLTLKQHESLNFTSTTYYYYPPLQALFK